jgi:hypothetical protein
MMADHAMSARCPLAALSLTLAFWSIGCAGRIQNMPEPEILHNSSF